MLTKSASHASGGQQQAMVIRDMCPRRQSPKDKKNGHIHNSKQNHQCHDCGRQFVDCFAQYLVSGDTRALIERWLGERISLPGICRGVGVGLKGLSGFLVHGVEALPDHLHVQPATCQDNVTVRRLEVEADAIHSVVQQKATELWIWIAMDAKPRQVMAFHGGIAAPSMPSLCGPRFRWCPVPTPHPTPIIRWYR